MSADCATICGHTQKGFIKFVGKFVKGFNSRGAILVVKVTIFGNFLWFTDPPDFATIEYDWLEKAVE